MNWWQTALALLVGFWLLATVAEIAKNADKAARDAAWLRYELEQLKTWAERNTEIQMTRQKTILSRLHWLRQRMGYRPDDDDT